ncbi:MAG TPA: DNA-processing protein DprA [Patescibacteria group bacterium]|jgi:DNA processing protein|nr:DNA-processing protein DprA [Patescibacteria group bacterium]
MKTNEIILHLSLVKDFGSVKIAKLINYCSANGIELAQIYLFSRSDFQNVGFTLEKSIALVNGLQNQSLLDKELTLLDQENVEYITIVDENYPELLAQIYAPPVVVYWKGIDSALLSHRSLAVVGSRACNSYGKEVVQELLPPCIAQGITIVSGGALGIDTLAHQIAIDNQGKTIVVLGSGLLKPYPWSNKKLFEQVIERNGIIISSFPLQAEALSGNFPARNRIIAGLATTTLVVQAAEKSGALITAHYALEQGKNVAAVPGSLFDPLSVGCNNLIKQGAYLINNASDLLFLYDINYQESLSVPSAKKIKEKEVKKSSDIILTLQQQRIVECCKAASCTIDEIVEQTNFSADLIHAELFNLECLGIIQNDFLHWKTMN